MSTFLGTYTHTVDEQGRTNIPAPIRDSNVSEDKEKWALTPGLDGCLYLKPMDEWEKFDQLMRSLDFIEEESARETLRDFYSNGSFVKVGKQGRITIPRSLLEHAGITDSVVFKGVLETVELWSPQRLEERRRTRSKDLADSTKEAFRLSRQKRQTEGRTFE